MKKAFLVFALIFSMNLGAQEIIEDFNDNTSVYDLIQDVKDETIIIDDYNTEFVKANIRGLAERMNPDEGVALINKKMEEILNRNDLYNDVIFPTIVRIDDLLEKGDVESAKFLSPFVSKFNPEIGKILETRVGLPSKISIKENTNFIKDTKGMDVLDRLDALKKDIEKSQSLGEMNISDYRTLPTEIKIKPEEKKERKKFKPVFNSLEAKLDAQDKQCAWGCGIAITYNVVKGAIKGGAAGVVSGIADASITCLAACAKFEDSKDEKSKKEDKNSAPNTPKKDSDNTSTSPKTNNNNDPKKTESVDKEIKKEKEDEKKEKEDEKKKKNGDLDAYPNPDEYKEEKPEVAFEDSNFNSIKPIFINPGKNDVGDGDTSHDEKPQSPRTIYGVNPIFVNFLEKAVPIDDIPFLIPRNSMGINPTIINFGNGNSFREMFNTLGRNHLSGVRF